jgi:cell wall-associated NlpC family hydrolase
MILKTNTLRSSLAAIFASVTLAGCATTPAITVQDGVKSVQAFVRASSGGTLELPDGARLEIPANALAQDTTITLAMPAYQTRQSEDLYFEITPSLELNAAARLTIPTRDFTPDQSAFTVQQSSVFQPTQDQGSELSSFAPSKVIAADAAADTLTLETTHFTGFAVLNWVDDPAYMVVDIPDAYLKPGDILLTLSAEHPIGNSKHTPNWFPGHVGLIVGRDQFPVDAKVTLPNGQPVTGVASEPNIIESVEVGVRPGSIELFRKGFDDDHLYMGPRTLPAKLNLTDADRAAAVAFAKAQLGKPYNLVGDGGHFLASLIAGVTFNKIPAFKQGGFSCVGLIDAAYKSINKSPIKWYDRSVLAVTPQDMYKATVPISNITVKVGDALEIPVYGTVIAPETKSALGVTIQGHYMRDRTRTVGSVTSSYAIAPQNLPQGATWTENPDGYIFKWTVQASAQPVVVKFTMTSNANTTRVLDGKPDDQPGAPIAQELTINVVP